MNHVGLCIKPPPKGSWEAEISADRCLKDWTWLYSYEAVRKGWLTASPGFLNSPFLKPMHTRDVVFYDPKRNVARSGKVKEAAARTRKAEYLQVTQITRLLRGVDHFFDFDSGSDY